MTGVRLAATLAVMWAAAFMPPSSGRAASGAETPPGSIRFRGHTAIGSSEGEFRRWRITRAIINENRPEHSTVEVVIDLGSLDTGNATRDRHLRSADFFDVERYPTAVVSVGDVRLDDPQGFTAAVRVDIHGRSRTFPMHFAIVDRAARRIAGRITLKRSDFDVGTTRRFFNPLRVDDAVDVVVEATVPPANDASGADADPGSNDVAHGDGVPTPPLGGR